MRWELPTHPAGFRTGSKRRIHRGFVIPCPLPFINNINYVYQSFGNASQPYRILDKDKKLYYDKFLEIKT